MIWDREPVFQGEIDTNTWKDAMAGKDYDVRKGHGQIMMGADGPSMFTCYPPTSSLLQVLL